jgi:hypothetical protein
LLCPSCWLLRTTNLFLRFGRESCLICCCGCENLVLFCIWLCGLCLFPFFFGLPLHSLVKGDWKVVDSRVHVPCWCSIWRGKTPRSRENGRLQEMQWQYCSPFSKLSTLVAQWCMAGKSPIFEAFYTSQLSDVWLEESQEFTPTTGASGIRIPSYSGSFEGSNVQVQ